MTKISDYKTAERRIARAQRALAKKALGSKNRAKAVMRLAKIQRNIACQRKVFTEHVSGEELYRRYPGQTQRQPCYVALDARTGRLYAAHNPEVGNAVPMAVHHGHVQRWTIPALVADAANLLLDDVAPHAALVVAGYSSAWDGQNNVARFTPEAREAIEEIDSLCEAMREAEGVEIVVWDAADYFAAVGSHDTQRAELGIGAATTDENLDAIVTREAERAAADGIHVIDGLAAYLRGLRDGRQPGR